METSFLVLVTASTVSSHPHIVNHHNNGLDHDFGQINLLTAVMNDAPVLPDEDDEVGEDDNDRDYEDDEVGGKYFHQAIVMKPIRMEIMRMMEIVESWR